MKFVLKKLISVAVQNDWVWALLDGTVVRVARYAEAERLRHRKQAESRRAAVIAGAIEAIFPDLVVTSGVFKGMRYPEATSVGSALFPKLLGSYEKELHPLLESLCDNDYTEIIDIGCAEGYYAVGLARRITGARVFAFDINEQAILLCRKMAELNDVGARVITGKACTADTLRSLPLTRRALVVSDCEGYERDLFTEDAARLLGRHDLLIETHDFIDINISSTLIKRFRGTHEIQAISSIGDAEKARAYRYGELSRYDLATRRILLAERRPAIMTWLYMRPRRDAR
jgi:hypothetical protein